MATYRTWKRIFVTYWYLLVLYSNYYSCSTTTPTFCPTPTSATTTILTPCTLQPPCWSQPGSWICLRSQALAAGVEAGAQKEEVKQEAKATDWLGDADDWGEEETNGNLPSTSSSPSTTTPQVILFLLFSVIQNHCFLPLVPDLFAGPLPILPQPLYQYQWYLWGSLPPSTGTLLLYSSTSPSHLIPPPLQGAPSLARAEVEGEEEGVEVEEMEIPSSQIPQLYQRENR